ncbi:RHS repeat-associated core domain-containing protein [Polymorphospora sp. A560]
MSSSTPDRPGRLRIRAATLLASVTAAAVAASLLAVPVAAAPPASESRPEWTVPAPVDDAPVPGRVAATTPLPAPAGDGARAGAARAAAPAAVGTTAAGGAAGAGDWSATPLTASADWDAGDQTGSFTWEYPLRVPPAPGGPEPDLGFGYSSGAVDGRTAATNNQPSWVGEGFDLGTSYVERRYKACADDGSAGTPKRGDLCWGHDNAFLVLNGTAAELVRDDATGTWRPRNDDGSRIEKLTGADNGDNDGEYWRVTTVDGTRYTFGLNRLTGWTSQRPVTNSAWTVPVYGNNSGEPCYNATFANAWCQQAWRWNLDLVTDRDGNAMTYHYVKESNRYGRNNSTTALTEYTRGGHLARIDYGLRADALFAAAPAQVRFNVAERCLPSGTITCSDAQFVKANAAHWPDVPVDLNCATGTSCLVTGPSFWSRKRLTEVTTAVLDGTAYRDVDHWALRQEFPRTDASPAGLWLAGITHTGRAGGTAAVPEVRFLGVGLPNRVDANEGISPMVKWRLRTITSESGGVTTVNYSAPDCTRASLPTPDSNTRRCFPAYWTPEGSVNPTLDWFHKYVVTSVVADGRVEGVPAQETHYEYDGDPAWHYADDDGLSPAKYRTWSEWRGYGRVRTIEGAPGGQRSETERLYLRGMHGDRLAAGGTRGVTVTDSQGGTVTDHPYLAGFLREEIVRNGPDGAEVEGSVHDPWSHGPTATRVRSWGTVHAYVTEVGRTVGRTALEGGGYRRTETGYTYDSRGLVTQVDDRGDVTTTADDRCTRTTYAQNTSAWLLDFPSRVETVAKACASTPARPADVVSDERSHYDGLAFGAAPTRGNVTREERLAAADSYQTVRRATYDANGRVVEEFDALGNRTTTAYTPATGGPVRSVTVTNPLGHAGTTQYDPAWGAVTAEVDANGRRTELAWDPLGRLLRVWLPGRSRSAQTPHTEYAYQVRTDGPTVVTVRHLDNTGTGYLTTYTLYDGLLRERQVQEQAPGGGRIVTDTHHDSRGLVVRESDPYPADGAPATSVHLVADAAVPALNVTVYDGAERPTAEIFLVHGVERWRTTTGHGGDRTHVTPPAGDTPTTEIVDARDNVVELRQYHGATATGGYDATRYTYTRDDEIASITDPAGNVWRRHYDLRGRLVRVEDPDQGTTTSTYDDLDRTVTETDSRGQTVVTVYDALDRVTATHAGSATGAKLTGYTYDTVAKGQVSTATRYVGGQAYTVATTAYDQQDRPTATRYVVPAAAGALAGSYEFSSVFNVDGTLSRSTLPAGGGLSAETVRYGYDAHGRPTTLAGATSYVTESTYSKLDRLLRRVYSTGSGPRVLRDYGYETGTERLVRVVTERELNPVRVADTRYDHDPSGNILRIGDTPPGGLTADVQCFTYDRLRRLTRAWTPGSGDCAATPSVAGLGGAAPYWHAYTYDKVGNRLTETRYAAAGTGTHTYRYPAAGAAQPHTLREVAVQGPGARTDSYGYDAAGNTVSRNVAGRGQTLTWDVEGNLGSIAEGGASTRFVYGADGTRLLRHDPDGGATLFLPGTELRLTAGAVTATRYYSQDGETVATRSGGGVHWQLADHLGTDQLAVDAATGGLIPRRFLPFGELRGGTPTGWPGQRSFVGGVDDDPVGLLRLGAREYDPSTGRFLSVDPVILEDDPQQFHGYSYANNNPITFEDADGLYPKKKVVKAKKKKVAKKAVKKVYKKKATKKVAKKKYVAKKPKSKYVGKKPAKYKGGKPTGYNGKKVGSPKGTKYSPKRPAAKPPRIRLPGSWELMDGRHKCVAVVFCRLKVDRHVTRTFNDWAQRNNEYLEIGNLAAGALAGAGCGIAGPWIGAGCAIVVGGVYFNARNQLRRAAEENQCWIPTTFGIYGRGSGYGCH